MHVVILYELIDISTLQKEGVRTERATSVCSTWSCTRVGRGGGGSARAWLAPHSTAVSWRLLALLETMGKCVRDTVKRKPIHIFEEYAT